MMLQSTTPILEGHPIKEYKGIVSAQSIIGANVLKDFMAGMRDFFGGRSKAYEKVYRQAKEDALRELAEEAVKLGGNAIVGVRLDFESAGTGGMLMVAASGTAVVI